jgi:hypothetical protein
VAEAGLADGNDGMQAAETRNVHSAAMTSERGARERNGTDTSIARAFEATDRHLNILRRGRFSWVRGRSLRYAEGITSPESEPTLPSRVALLVDYPVLLRAIRAVESDAVPRLAEMVRRARTFGAVFVARGYGAWYDVDEATSAFNEGLDPVFVPPAGPGTVPTTSALVVDGLSMLRSGQVQGLVLSGDDRLLPLVAAAHAAGQAVTLLAHSCQPDGPCLKLASYAEPAAAYARAMTRAERFRRPSPAA